jgi:hypothetical protein
VSGRPAGISLPDKELLDPAIEQTKSDREQGLAVVPPLPRRRKLQIPKGYNQYIQSIYADENYAIEHLDCGQPPDNRVFASSLRYTDDLPKGNDPLGTRLQEAYLDDDSEAWSPPDEPMEND